ncbi:MAG TPA: hypothetical protein DCZ03_13765 [Gammaproteobacteria bacterium]|nr:hypothetical protein [Gammaproteobacteria bacterium]
MIKNILILSIAFSFSDMCFAEEDSKWFIGFGLGSAEYDGSNFSGSDNLISLSGGYIFSGIFSFEAGYIDLGNVKDRIIPDNVISIHPDTLSLEAQGFTIASKFSWEVAEPLALSAKLGVSILDIDKQWSGGTVFNSTLTNDTGGTETEFFFGAQLQYIVGEKLTIELNWDRYKVEDVDIDGIYGKVNIHF